MDYQLSFLKEQDYPLLFQTFQDAFDDYIVDMSYMDEDMLYNRWIKNHVQYRASVGVWEFNQLVGFTMISTDVWRGVPSAFNAATGVIERYRGKGITKEMIDFVIPKLKKVGIQKLWLEVIQNNEPAMKAYKKAGFEIVRDFDCYKLQKQNYQAPEKLHEELVIREVEVSDVKVRRTWFEWQPSWENTIAAVQRVPDEKFVLGGFLGDELVGYIVYYPAFSQIMQLVVAPLQRGEKIATTLLDHLVQHQAKEAEAISYINIVHSDDSTTDLLKKLGFEFTIGQHEMALDLTEKQ